MAKNQHGRFGLSVRAPLAERIERYHRLRRLHFDEGKSLSELEESEGISRQRIRQIIDGPEPRKPGRPWDKRGRA